MLCTSPSTAQVGSGGNVCNLWNLKRHVRPSKKNSHSCEELSIEPIFLPPSLMMFPCCLPIRLPIVELCCTAVYHAGKHWMSCSNWNTFDTLSSIYSSIPQSLTTTSYQKELPCRELKKKSLFNIFGQWVWHRWQNKRCRGRFMTWHTIYIPFFARKSNKLRASKQSLWTTG